MADKTGIQMIEELCGRMAVLDRRQQVIEQLLKQLLGLARTEGPASCAAPQPVPKAAVSVSDQKSGPVPKEIPNSRVVGRIMDKGKPVPEVTVTVYDNQNKPVKRTRTNRSGEWMAYLPPGKYGAECVLEGRVNGNVTFTVANGAKMVRVGQPE